MRSSLPRSSCFGTQELPRTKEFVFNFWLFWVYCGMVFTTKATKSTKVRIIHRGGAGREKKSIFAKISVCKYLILLRPILVFASFLNFFSRPQSSLSSEYFLTKNSLLRDLRASAVQSPSPCTQIALARLATGKS